MAIPSVAVDGDEIVVFRGESPLAFTLSPAEDA
jgi:hypothetical protein